MRADPAPRGARWVRLLTRSEGSLTAHAAGAAKAGSRWSGRFDPLNLLEVEWVAGRSGVKRLRLANVVDSFAGAKAVPARAAPLLGGLHMAERVLTEGEGAGWAVNFIAEAAALAATSDPWPLFGLALGLRLLHTGGWLEERPGRQGEVMAQLLLASPAALAAWEWPEDALAAWHRGLAARWARHVDAPLGPAVPARFRSERPLGNASP